MKTIKRNDTGAAVEDIQQRLRRLGYELEVDGVFGQRTQQAVRDFRADEGLPVGDVVDDRTWSVLVDASFALGDRVLYLRMPYFHGGDVRSLQEILDVLGFIAGEPDGIFGAHTERALRDFQASVGLIDDGIAGGSTYDAIDRLKHAWEGKSPATAEADEHMGFARAAEALEKIEACFYGLDTTGRSVASRVANLAWATTSAARVTSADALGGLPPRDMLKVGVTAQPVEQQDGTPIIELGDGVGFSKRLGIAVASTGQDERRVIVQVPASGVSDDGSHVSDERWNQHLAVLLLDAFCSALR